jgi:hypothetical protein
MKSTVKFSEYKDYHTEQYRQNQHEIHMEEIAQESEPEVTYPNLNEEIINEIMEIVESSEKGHELIAYGRLKQLLKLINECLLQIEPLALQACDMHTSNNSAFEYKGFEFKRRNGSKTLEYNDVPQYVKKYKELQEYKEMLKIARMGVDSNTTMVQDKHMILADGEMIEMPKWKYSKDSIIVKKL